MSMWDMLTYMEASSANSKLEDISRENEEHRQNQAEQEINTGISSLFQELYNQSNDVSKINLSKVSGIKDYINSKFNNNKFNTYKPSRSYGTFIFMAFVGAVIYFISTAMLAGKGNTTVQVIILVVAGFFLLGSVLSISDDGKNIDSFNTKIKNFNNELPLLKIQFPNLSAFGIYLKWYLDSKCKDTIDILKKQEKEINPYETLKIFYTLFDLEANPNMNYNWNSVYNFNKELIENFDNLPKPQTTEVDGDFFISTTINYANGNKYIGELKNGLLNGKGKLTYSNNASYREGSFLNGELNGQGKTKYDDGDIYEGNFKNGLRHGSGNYQYHDGGYYNGEWNEGEKHGKGKREFKDGCIYDGDWINGEENGHAFLDCPTHTYQGEFKNGQKDGKGKAILSDGQILEGYFKNNDYVGTESNEN